LKILIKSYIDKEFDTNKVFNKLKAEPEFEDVTEADICHQLMYLGNKLDPKNNDSLSSLNEIIKEEEIIVKKYARTNIETICRR
jgi:hypothetical protein